MTAQTKSMRGFILKFEFEDLFWRFNMAPIITAKICCTDKLHSFSSFITAYSSYSGNLV